MSTSNTPTPTAAEVLADLGYAGFVNKLFNRSGDLVKDFAHATLGLATELHELRQATDEVNRLEEAGDLMFYHFASIQILLDAFPTLSFGDIEGATLGLVAHPGELGEVQQASDQLLNDILDAAKRWVGYGKAPPDPAKLAAQIIHFDALVVDEALPSVDNDRISLINVEKLLKRYHGLAFNAEHAVQRDLPAERQVLESAAAS